MATTAELPRNRRAADLLLHIGSPLLPNPLCGDRDWLALVHYDVIGPAVPDLPSLCRECLRIRREQLTTAIAR